MKAIVITPPLVQTNSPYPSGAYLSSFFKMQGLETVWYDLNIKLFYKIFSSQGLTKLFELSTEQALKLAQKAQKSGDEATAFNLRRYVSTQQQWILWIDWITAILRDGGNEKTTTSTREKQHQFLYSPFSPRGNRMESYLQNLDHEPTVDDVRLLCTFALADLSDYITAVFDSNFSLIRYAESLAVDERDFSQIEAELDSPIMEHFFKPVLEEELGGRLPYGSNESNNEEEETVASYPSSGHNKHQVARNAHNKQKTLVCISIPFAGTLLPALYTARYIKQNFADSTYVCIGGGFVNTELRNAKDPILAKYVDAISYDRGYGSYYQLGTGFGKNDAVYKMRKFIQLDGAESKKSAVKVIEPLWENPEISKLENEFTQKVMPDYSDIDFSIYPRICDDTNPMHRLWTDGTWIKAYLAHGCYWHKCAFCDTQLDYVCAYKPVEVENLYKTLLCTAEQKGVYGIHFVDEALPPKMLKEFAMLNAKSNNPLYYWGNVRFEKTFTKDLAAFLSSGGFAAVSAGLEVATGSGLKNINKGTDIQSIVSACAAFKEAGILVHAYMIYGFWNDTPQSIIDSMETLRQFFVAGLLDSAFWHKFVLTRNSQVYKEWKQGLHPELKPIEPKSDGSMFAQNNLHFKGEGEYDKFGSALESALNSWMHGDKLDMKIQRWFNFPVPAPTISKNYIEKLIENYEQENQKLFQNEKQPTEKEINGLYWLGSKPVVIENSLYWMYLQEEFQFDCQNKNQAIEIKKLLESLGAGTEEKLRSNVISNLEKSKEYIKLLHDLHGKGLVRI